MVHHEDDGNDENLVTTTSLALSLAPPRAPPHGTAHRMLLLGKDPTNASLTHHHDYDHDDDDDDDDYHDDYDYDYDNRKSHSKRKYYYSHHGIRSRIHQILQNMHLEKVSSGGRSSSRHPFLPTGPEASDQITRWIGATLPLWWQNQTRDNGGFRSLSDGLVALSVPSMAIGHPVAAGKFLSLTRNGIRIRYGRHEMQTLDLFLPFGGKGEGVRGLMFFVHGGAWGSGKPWMYRLVAAPFLEMNMAVAIVGYRTYPDGDVDCQVADLRRAALLLHREYPHFFQRRRGSDTNNSLKDDRDWLGVCLMGHSSGAHIAFLLLVQQIRKCLDCKLNRNRNRNRDSSSNNRQEPSILFDSFVGLSGVYSISHHFDYEAGRGVEEISPMKPACGHTRESFEHYSPAISLRKLLLRIHEHDKGRGGVEGAEGEESLSVLIPRILLLHGVEDSTVPFTSTSDAAYLLRSMGVSNCTEYYVPRCGHVDVAMHLMLGGRVRNVVKNWIEETCGSGGGDGGGDGVGTGANDGLDTRLVATSKL